MVYLGDKYLPPSRVSELSADQRECYEVCAKTWADTKFTPADILTMLTHCNYIMGDAMKLAQRLTQANSHFLAPPTVLDLAPFCSLNGSGGPDACQYLLENEKGVCARDIHGRPVSICRGMFYGTFREDILMVKYALQRAAQYYQKDTAKSLLLIFDLSIYQDCAQTFRFPDSVYQELVKYQQQYVLELMGTVSNVAVVGLPKMFATILDMMRRGFGYGCTWSFHVNYQALLESGLLTRDNLPTQHGGTFDFDLERYVKWRAKEEGLETELGVVKIRRFNDEGLLPLYSGVKGTSYLVRFPPTEAVVDTFLRADADNLFMEPLSVNGKPSVVVLCPWNELRVHAGSNVKRLGKIMNGLLVNYTTKVDSFTDFVFESAGAVVDKKNVSARYSVVIENPGGEHLVIEAAQTVERQGSLQKLVGKLTKLLDIYDNTVNYSEGIEELTGNDLADWFGDDYYAGSSGRASAQKSAYGSTGVDSSSDHSESFAFGQSPPAKGVSWNNVLNFLGSST